jgi:hypothetical protein
MSPTAGSGLGNETATSIDDLTKRFTAMEEAIKPLQPLIDSVKKLKSRTKGNNNRSLTLLFCD